MEDLISGHCLGLRLQAACASREKEEMDKTRHGEWLGVRGSDKGSNLTPRLPWNTRGI